MNIIPDKEEKMQVLWDGYRAYRQRMTFAEYVERESRERADFFRWLTGNERTEDFGRDISETARMMLLTAMI